MTRLFIFLLLTAPFSSSAGPRDYYPTYRNADAYERSSGSRNCGSVDLNCDRRQGRIGNGRPFPIVCGEGVRDRHGKRHSVTPSRIVRLNTMAWAAGRVLPKGTPMLTTAPPFCGDCFINGLSTNARSSWGCIRVGSAFSALRSCGRGTKITITHNRTGGYQQFLQLANGPASTTPSAAVNDYN